MNDSPKAFNQVVSAYQETAAASGHIKAVDHTLAPEAGDASYTKRSSVVKPSLSDFISDVEINARRCLSPAEFALWEAGYKSRAVIVNADGTPDESLEHFIRTFPAEKWTVKRIIDNQMRQKLAQRFSEVGLAPTNIYMQANDVYGRKLKTKPKEHVFDIQASADYSNVVCISDAEFVGDIHAAADISFEPLLSAREAAKLLGVHEKTIQALARSGEIPCLRFGKYWKFRESSLDAWVRERLISDHQSRRVS